MIWLAGLIYACALLVAYTWAGYPLFVWLLGRCRRKRTKHTGVLPTVTVLIAACNEEAEIAAKLEDCLLSDYPSDKFEIIVISDGSTDNTERLWNNSLATTAAFVFYEPEDELARAMRRIWAQKQRAANCCS